MKASKDSGSTTASLTPGSCRSCVELAATANKLVRQPSYRPPASEMTGNFRRRMYCLPREYGLEANAASVRDSISEQLRAQRDQIMQVTIEGEMQKRSFGIWWTTYWAVVDQTAVRFYENEQASISRPNSPVEVYALPLVPELSREHPSWVICRDAQTKRKVMFLRSGSEPAWEDVATARLWHWALKLPREGTEAN
ncbi:unnamed protein product [Effrenium voratum]|nr:unnamed protein product [Effrenium voratum]